MKVVILAGGFGTRLGSKTNLIPKPMVEIGGKPILWHIMKIYSHYNFNEFIICLGYKGEIIKDYFLHYEAKNNDFTIELGSPPKIEFHNNHKEDNWKVTLVDTGIDSLKGSRIKRIEKYLDNETNFLTYGDGVADINIPELLDFHKSHGKTITLTGVCPPSRFGEIVVQDNAVKIFEEKPQASQGLINGGFMVFNNNLLKHLSPGEGCGFESDVLADLSREGEVMVYRLKKQWACMDHERDVNYLNKLWAEGQAFWKVWE